MAAWLSDAEPGPQAVIDAPAAQPEQQPDVTEEPAPEVTEEPVEEPETAAVSSAVTYYDPGTGTEKTARNVTRVTADVTAWTQGWYEVWGAPTLERVSVQGSVNLILSHGTILTVTGGITVADGGSLTIWGSDENYNDDGELTVTGADRYCAGIGGGGNGASATVIVNGGVVKANGGVSPQPVNASGKTVYPMQVSNPEGEIVAVDGTVLAVRNHAAADGDTNLYAYVPATNPLVAVGSDRVEQYMLNEQTGRLDKTEGVRYYDPSVGQEQFHDTVKLLTAGQTNWTGDNESGGWYMAAGPLSVGEVFVSGSVNLVLANGSSLTSNGGIHVQSGSSLTIWGQNEDCMQDGTVTAQGDTFDPGTGTAAHISGGAVTINGGVITATGNDGGAGIGIGSGYAKAKVTITGGTVKAINNGMVTVDTEATGAGIGAGYSWSNATVNISGGQITATGGWGSAGVGSGYNSDVTVNISGGAVKAVGNSDGGAGVGAGWSWSAATVTINGGTVTANGGYEAAGVGTGYSGSSATVIVNGGTVLATGNGGGGIGSTSSAPR